MPHPPFRHPFSSSGPLGYSTQSLSPPMHVAVITQKNLKCECYRALLHLWTVCQIFNVVY